MLSLIPCRVALTRCKLSAPSGSAVPPPTSPPLPPVPHLFAPSLTSTKNHWDPYHLGKMPGAGKQSPQVQEHIKELLEAGFDPTTIHRKLKVGRSSIYRMKRCLQQHGTAYMPTELNKKNGRPKVLTSEQELVSLTSHLVHTAR